MKLAGVFVQIGLLPNTDWLKGVVKQSPRGEIEVNARGETSVSGVFAAGDCTIFPTSKSSLPWEKVPRRL